MNPGSDPEDPHDANYLRETSVSTLFPGQQPYLNSTYANELQLDLQRRAHKEALEQSASTASLMDMGDNAAGAAAQGDDDLVVDSLAADAAPDDQPQQQLLHSLDQAILHSIERCCRIPNRFDH